MASDQRKKMQKLSRMELLELLLEQTHENEILRAKLKKAEAVIADRHLAVTEAGDLAKAVLAVNDVVGAAQRAAEQYIYNAAELQRQTEQTCQRMLAEAREEAKRLRYEAMLGEELAGEILGEGTSE